METDKEKFIVFNEFIFLDHSEAGIGVNLNVLKKSFINRLHEAVLLSRKLIPLSLVDDSILKLHE